MNEEKSWHTRAAEIALKHGAVEGCKDIATMDRFVSLEALFLERPYTADWAVTHIPMGEWEDCDLSILCATNPHLYIYFYLRALETAQEKFNVVKEKIGVAVIEAYQRGRFIDRFSDVGKNRPPICITAVKKVNPSYYTSPFSQAEENDYKTLIGGEPHE